MTKFPFLIGNKRLFFYGCGGVSMSAICKYFLFNGVEIYGYDDQKTDVVRRLEELGLVFVSPKEIIDPLTIIVYTSAVENNDDFIRLKNQGLKMIKRSEMLSLIQKQYRYNFSVSGCHGKTTSTAMLAHVLNSAGKHPTAFIGGEDKDFSNFLLGKGSVCIAEACEFKANFLDMISDQVIILNVDDDHLDSYGSIENLKQAFSQFAKDRTAIINADDKNLNDVRGKKTITFGINNDATYTAKDIVIGDKTEFSVYEKSKFKTRITLNVRGVHNVYNALSVVASSREYGIGYKKIKRGLELFKGVARRCEEIGLFSNKTIVCDYAHHPTEIRALLKTINLKDTLVVFQPHTYSRTRLLMDDFISVLKSLDALVVYKTYSARENYSVKGSARTLYLSLVSSSKGKVYYAETPKKLVEIVKEFNDKKTIMLVGAGDIYFVGLNLVGKK